MSSLWAQRVRRGLRRSPREIIHRVAAETSAQIARFRGDPLGADPTSALLERCGQNDISSLWRDLASRPHPAQTAPVSQVQYDAVCSGENRQRIVETADEILQGRISLIGVGTYNLSHPIEWHKDPHLGTYWPHAYYRDIDLLDLARGTDVRTVWELSRLQWLIPVGQAYLLTQDARYAAFALDVIDSWIVNNPYGQGVNWGIAMEAAMRGITWTWFFHVFGSSDAWSVPGFQERFLCALYRHGVFIERNQEEWGVSGNHLVADGAGLCVLGYSFGDIKDAQDWRQKGWAILTRAIKAQILTDGICFEAATGYHRLTAELFYWPAAFRVTRGESVPDSYLQKLSAMTEFTIAATRPDGSVPQWGDGDDARVLPFGDQSIHDHRYLRSFIRSLETPENPITSDPVIVPEAAWALGLSRVTGEVDEIDARSRSFQDGGVFVMASGQDHVFIDCGPVGYDGLGGHGHNDCLSFDAVLDGTPLVSDSGTFTYSSSAEARNSFRGTASHSTPMIDGEEQNRLIAPEELWRLHDDANPSLRCWEVGTRVDVFEGSHSGYLRLTAPVTPVRTILLEKLKHRLLVIDRFMGEGVHTVEIPFHLEPNVMITEEDDGIWSLRAGEKRFKLLILEIGQWAPKTDLSWVSRRYGDKESRPVIRFSREGVAQKLSVAVGPWGSEEINVEEEDLRAWAERVSAQFPADEFE